MYTEGKGPYRGANSYVTRQGFEASYAGREVGCWGTAAISSHESGGVLRAVETPEMPNYVNDMAADEEAMDGVVDATVAGVPVQTGTKETVGTDTLTVIGGLADVVNSEWRLRPTDSPSHRSSQN